MSNIFQQYLSPPKSYNEYSAELDAADARKQAARMNELELTVGQQKLDDYRASKQRGQNLLTTLANIKPGASAAERSAELERGGYLKEAQDLAESDAKVLKDQRAAEKDHLTNVKDRWAVLNNAISGSVDQASYSQNRAALASMGIDVSGIPEQFDPTFIANAKQQALTEMQRADQLWKQKGFDLDAQKAAESVRHNKVTESNTIRDQNLRNERAREANANGAGANGGKAPAGYRWTTAGELEAIPGGPAGNKATSSEGERKAATLLQRLEFSEKQLEAAVKNDPTAAKPSLIANGLRGAGMEAAANTLTGTERQKVDAAQLDILDAALTLGTGAAYTREQLEGYRKSYFPQVGDRPENIADKQARLKNVIDAAKTQAGRSAPKAKPVPADNNIDALLEKYKD